MISDVNVGILVYICFCMYLLTYSSLREWIRVHRHCFIGGWVWEDRPRRGHLVLLSVYLLLVNLLEVGYG